MISIFFFLFPMKLNYFKRHYFSYHNCTSVIFTKIFYKPICKSVDPHKFCNKELPLIVLHRLAPLLAHLQWLTRPVEGFVCVWSGLSFFWPLLKANYARLFSDWGACQYYTVGELSLAPRCILIHEP